jgi:lipopolysaccharide transport system permease protein
MPMTSTSSLSPDAPAPWVITPDDEAGVAARLGEAWRYRRIFWFFSTRAIRGLYAKTRLGWPWLVIRPLAPILVGSLVYGSVVRVDPGPYPYFLFFLIGSIVWNCFDGPLLRATRGLESNRQLIRQLYIPRAILPATQLVAGLIEPLVCVGMLLAALWHYHSTDGTTYVAWSARLLVAPVAAAMPVALALALSLWTSPWQARMRDVKFVLGYVVGFWYFLTPVVYPLSALPRQAQWVAALNPMTGPVEAFRWALLGGDAFPAAAFAASLVTIAVLFAAGLWFFARVESATADRL